MILGTESCVKVTVLGLVFCAAFSLPACSDDEPVEHHVQEDAAEELSLPVRQWYPQPKYSRYRTDVAPQYAQPQMMQPPPAYQSSRPAGQQGWESQRQTYQPAPPPTQSQVYGGASGWQAPVQQQAVPPHYYQQAPAQQVYQAPVQQWGTQQQFVTPYYNQQTPQRPWGEVPRQTPVSPWSTGTAPSQQAQPWYGGHNPGIQGQGYPGWETPYGGYPGSAVPGHLW